jgi:hypothetical protein
VRFGGLAAALVERLAPHVPAGIELREQPQGFVQAWVTDERWEAFPLDEPELEEEIPLQTYDPPQPAFAVLEALDFLQEYVRSDVDVDWEDGEPWADLEDGEIRFGYGDTSFEPIALDSLRDD